MTADNSKMVKGAEAFILSLINEGVDTIFGYPGGTIMPIYDELYSYSKEINHILVRHEQGAVHAAQGYARSSGKVGVCMATAGPGATNFVTGIADAMMDSTPIVCVTAQVNADKLGSNFFQEADMIGITLPITKWSFQITDATQIPRIMAKAFKIATEGRPGPVVISVAKNAQVGMVDANSILPKTEEDIHKAPELTTEAIESLTVTAELLNKAKRPLIIAGHGVMISEAEESLKAVFENGNIPVSTTRLGLSSIDTDNKLYYGNVGMHGHLAPNKMTQEADVILAVGMRFSDRVTGETDGYAPKAKIIHIDIDRAEINKNVQTNIAIIADADKALSFLAKEVKFKERAEWFAYADGVVEYENKTIKDNELADNTIEIKMAKISEAICKIGKNEQLIVTDVGQNQMFAARYGMFSKNRSWITSGGLGTMGYGLPAAIGAKVGQPERDVVLVTGDGGFQMNIQELGTILQSNIKVKIVLYNNSFLGMVRQWQELFFDKRYAFTPLANPDFMQVAAAYGIKAERISSPSQIDDAVKRMYEWDGAYILEAVVENEENVFPMVPAGATLSQIIDKKP